MDPNGGSRVRADESLVDALAQTSFTVISIVTEVAARHGVSLTQLRLVAILRDHTPTMTELARHLGLDRSTISGLISRATERGLVARVEHDTDARSHRVALTDAGSDLAAKGAADIATEMASHVQRLTATERNRLSQLLRAFNPVR